MSNYDPFAPSAAVIDAHIEKNADTDKVYSVQAKYIWPVAAVLLIIAAYFFGMQHSAAGSCAQAVVKADEGFNLLYDGFGAIGDHDTVAGARIADEVAPVMTAYWDLSEKCQD